MGFFSGFSKAQPKQDYSSRGPFGSRRGGGSGSTGGRSFFGRRWGGLLDKVRGQGAFGVTKRKKHLIQPSERDLLYREEYPRPGLHNAGPEYVPGSAQYNARRAREKAHRAEWDKRQDLQDQFSDRNLYMGGPPGMGQQPGQAMLGQQLGQVRPSSPWGAGLGQQIGGYAGGVQPLGQIQEPQPYQNMFKSAGLGY